jgi:transposase
MFIDWNKAKIFIKPGFTDMRKQINGLALIASKEISNNIFAGNLFLFCSKSRRHLKILYWDRNGFCLWYKRLEKDKFPWPKNTNEIKELSTHQLSMLLDGIDFFNAHKKLYYKKVS